MPPPSEPVSEALIAAFLDGTLESDRRDEVARRIARDPSARWRLAEAARFVAEVPAPVEARPSVFVAAWERTRPALRRVKTSIVICGTLAASLMVVVLPRVAQRFATGGMDADWYATLSAGGAAKEMAAVLPAGEANVLGFATAHRPESRSFRAGVAELDFEIVLRSARSGQPRTPEVLDQVREGIDGSKRTRLTAALEQAVARPGPASLAELNRALLSSVPDRAHYELGRWVEASRVAAATSNQRFFGSPDFQAALGRARGMALPEEVRTELARAASAAQAERPDFRRLERAFEQVSLLY
jgi:hypothetical protein